MAIKIVKPSDPIVTENIIVVLYGCPGAGKTTLGFSTDKPLLLDCDLGSQRALPGMRKDSVRVKQWSDIADLTHEDMAPFNTIVIDTAGRLLEIMEAEIKKTNPAKMINRLNGSLSLAGFGQLVTMFKSFMLKLKTQKKDIVLILHDRDKRVGEKISAELDAMGQTNKEIIKIADLIGFVSMSGKERTLDFNPTEDHLGKNCAEIPEQKIPNLAEYKSYLADLITLTKKKMNTKSEEMIKAEQEFQASLDKIHSLETLEEFNAALIDLKDATPVLKQQLVNMAKVKGLIFDKEPKQFIEEVKQCS